MAYLRTIHQVQFEMTLDTSFEGVQYIHTRESQILTIQSNNDQMDESLYLCHVRCASRNEHARLTAVADKIAVTLGFPVRTPSSI